MLGACLSYVAFLEKFSFLFLLSLFLPNAFPMFDFLFSLPYLINSFFFTLPYQFFFPFLFIFLIKCFPLFPILSCPPELLVRRGTGTPAMESAGPTYVGKNILICYYHYVNDYCIVVLYIDNSKFFHNHHHRVPCGVQTLSTIYIVI